MTTQTPLMRVQDISKSLGGRKILKSISLDLYEVVKVLIGPSGGGKSTLYSA